MVTPTPPSTPAQIPTTSTTSTGPVRTCLGCRRRAAKRELVRVTVGSDADGGTAVVPDPDATAPGRGAHLHPTTECYELAVRRKAWARALRHSGGRPDSPAHRWGSTSAR